MQFSVLEIANFDHQKGEKRKEENLLVTSVSLTTVFSSFVQSALFFFSNVHLTLLQFINRSKKSSVTITAFLMYSIPFILLSFIL